MFCKRRIMRKLTFGEYTSIEEILSWFPQPFQEKAGNAIDLLGKLGFIEPSEDLKSVSLRTLSSFQDYKAYCAKQFFEYAVGISAAIVAIESLLNIIGTVLEWSQQTCLP